MITNYLYYSYLQTDNKRINLTAHSDNDIGINASLRAHLDQVLHTVVLPGLTRLNSEGARLNR